MIRAALSALTVLALPALSFADQDRDPRVEAILDELPSEAEMRDVLDQMPDLNAMMTGIIDIAEDPETLDTLERVGARLEERLEGIELAVQDGEVPDLNLIMEEMIGLASDRDTMGDVLGLMFQVVDVIEASAGDTER